MLKPSDDLISNLSERHVVPIIRAELYFYSGAQPSNPNSDPTGMLLMEGKADMAIGPEYNDGLFDLIMINWTDYYVIASGSIGWLRMHLKSGGKDLGSFDGSAGYSGCDLNMVSTAVIPSKDFYIDITGGFTFNKKSLIPKKMAVSKGSSFVNSFLWWIK